MEKYNIIIDGKKIEAPKGQTILDAARDNGISIPTLCADGRTEIYGACGMCVCEVEGNPKLVKACATEIADGMIVHTDTPRALASRKTMLELLLSNHTGDCRPPCVLSCPAHTDCQGYIGLVANGCAEEAYRLIFEKIPLPASIGRVCPHPCEEECRRGLVEENIGIMRIKRFCGDTALECDADMGWMPDVPDETGKKVCIVGGGPYGLSLAFFLRLKGHSVTIYEAMPKAGGMLRYGIPEYRLPKAVLDAEIARIEKMGVKIETGKRVGPDISFESIRENYDAVCLGIGAWISTGTGAKGEDLPGVFGGIDLLSKIARGEEVRLGKRLAVVGGGNTAMDACRTAVRLGVQEVYNVYRRTRNEMPAEQDEIDEADEEGVIFKELTNPIEIIPGKDGSAAKIELQIMELGEPDESGRRSPRPVEGKTETLDVDTVVLAIGQQVDPASLGIEGLDLTRKKGIAYDPATFMTSLPGVFAGGDCGNDKVSIAIEAIADAKHSAPVIDAYLNGEEGVYIPEYSVIRKDITERSFEGRERLFRPPVDMLTAEERRRNFAEIAAGWDEEEVKSEALRCLECGCGDYFECKLVEYANEYDVKPERFSGDLSIAEADGSLPAPGADDDGHPFIEREEGKCILCGLCVRVCDEVVGAAALGFAGRGFDTVVAPAFSLPLAESGCLSCGLCVDACPTGAIRERLLLQKSVPLETKATNTTCPHCGIGCQLTLETKGSLLVKANPNDLCCGRGKFGFSDIGEKLVYPLMRDKKTGKLAQVSWQEAFAAAAGHESARHKVRPILSCGAAVSVSDRLTNEEAKAAKDMAGSLGASAFSFNNRASARLAGGLADSSFEDMLASDLILTVCLDFKESPVLGMKLRRAAASGVRIVSIETGDIDDGASFGTRIEREIINIPDDLKSLNEIVEAQLRGNALIVYQRNMLTYEAAELLCSKAPVFEVMPKNNSRGLADLGIDATPMGVADIKTLIIIGEDPVGQITASGELPDELKAAKELLEKVEFLVVCDTHITATAKKADLVLPMAGFASFEGTYTNTEGRILDVSRAVEPSLPYSTVQICEEIAALAGPAAAPQGGKDSPHKAGGRITSPLKTSDHLTRLINRRLGTEIYGD